MRLGVKKTKRNRAVVVVSRKDDGKDDSEQKN